MDWVILGFSGLAAVVALIIGVAAWVVFRRDSGQPNGGVSRPRRGRIARSDPSRGVPKTR